MATKKGDEASELANTTKGMSRKQLDLYIGIVNTDDFRAMPMARRYREQLKIAKAIVERVCEGVAWLCDCGHVVTCLWYSKVDVDCTKCKKSFTVDLSERAARRVTHGPENDPTGYDILGRK